MPDDALVVKGIVMAFMVMLSAQDHFTFRVSHELLSAFPYSDFELRADRDPENGDTVFSLHHDDTVSH